MAFYSATIVLCILTLLVLIVLTMENDILSGDARRNLIISALMVMVAACCEYIGFRLNGADPAWRVPHMLVKFMELSIAPAIPVLYGCTIYPVKTKRWIYIPLGAHALIEFLSMWLGIVFSVDAGNVYHHETFYFIYYTAYVLALLFMIRQMMRFSRRFQNRNKLSLMVILLFIAFGIVFQSINSSVKVVWMAMAVGFLMLQTYYCCVLQQVDALTGLLNRRRFDNYIAHAHKPAVILLADVDAFKNANDMMGHQFGDDCLVIIGEALKKAYGKCGLCYRIGGDEFCVILTKGLDTVDALNTTLFALLEEKQREVPHLPGVSVGYARFDPSGMNATEAVAQADEMMYRQKAEKKQLSR